MNQPHSLGGSAADSRDYGYSKGVYALGYSH